MFVGELVQSAWIDELFVRWAGSISLDTLVVRLLGYIGCLLG